MQARVGDGRRRLLLVDDRPEICDVIRTYLVAEGYDVTSVASGKAALVKLSTESFDILLVDAVMPGVDGLSIAEIAARNGAAVLVMTGDPETLENLSAASYPFIAKPFHLRDLLTRLSTIGASAAKRARRSRGRTETGTASL
jgi:DNA-binding response OmpR family regulator